MKVLVVGGNGFLGKRLIESLVRANVETSSIVRSTSNTQVEGCHYVLVDQIINMRHQDLPKFNVIINVAMKRSSRAFFISAALLVVPWEDVKNTVGVVFVSQGEGPGQKGGAEFVHRY